MKKTPTPQLSIDILSEVAETEKRRMITESPIRLEAAADEAHQ